MIAMPMPLGFVVKERSKMRSVVAGSTPFNPAHYEIQQHLLQQSRSPCDVLTTVMVTHCWTSGAAYPRTMGLGRDRSRIEPFNLRHPPSAALRRW
jgi:hypothetical protein